MPATPANKRPLSPHLQVYHWYLTMTMSILHRMTGVALSIGTLMVLWWLMAAACGPEAYEIASSFISSPLGIFMMFGWSASLYYHLLNGIRHLIWDAGQLLSLKGAYASGYVVLLLTVLATAATWYEVYN